jgi:hypothetical protein
MIMVYGIYARSETIKGPPQRRVWFVVAENENGEIFRHARNWDEQSGAENFAESIDARLQLGCELNMREWALWCEIGAKLAVSRGQREGSRTARIAHQLLELAS